MSIPTVSPRPAASETHPTATATTDRAVLTSSGIANAPTTITSAAPDHRSLSAKISAWVTNIIHTVRNFLEKLPGIGRLFKQRERIPIPAPSPEFTLGQEPIPAPSPEFTLGQEPIPAPFPGEFTLEEEPIPPDTTTWTNAQRLDMIHGLFPDALDALIYDLGVFGELGAVRPRSIDVYNALRTFTQISDPVMKMKAFHRVLIATTSTDHIARQFYDALPEGDGALGATRQQFRQHIYIVNRRNDEGRGMRFGEHIVDTAIRGELAKQAANNLQIVLEAAAIVAPTTNMSTTASRILV